MAHFSSRLAVSGALLALFSMASAPATAAQLPVQHGIRDVAPTGVAQGWDAANDKAERYRGWYGGRHRHRGGIDAGDVIAGVLVLGGIAAIASAASKSNKDRDYRDDYPDRDYRSDDYRDHDRPNDYRGADSGDSRLRGASGLDNAVNACVSEVERSEPVGEVDKVERDDDGDGWVVEGELRDGRDFTCAVDGAGQVRDVDLDSDVANAGSDERQDSMRSDSQRDDDYYTAARRQHEESYPPRT